MLKKGRASPLLPSLGNRLFQAQLETLFPREIIPKWGQVQCLHSLVEQYAFPLSQLFDDN